MAAGASARASDPIRSSRAGALPEVRPTLGARPLRTSVPVQRDASDAGTGGASEPATPDLVAARWSSGGNLPATIDALPLAGPAGDTVPLQRLASPAPPQAVANAGGPPAMREIVFPSPGSPGAAMTAMAASSTAVQGSPIVARSALPPSTAGRGGTWQPARSGVEPALDLARVGAPAAGSPAPSPGAGPPAQRAIEPTAGSPAPAVQATRPGPSSVPDISVTPVIQRIDGSAPTSQPGPGGARSDKELDELAQALFGRLRTRLRTEVIHEREARGLGFDAF